MIVATGVYALLLRFLQKNSPHNVQTKGGGGVKGFLDNVKKLHFSSLMSSLRTWISKQICKHTFDKYDFWLVSRPLVERPEASRGHRGNLAYTRLRALAALLLSPFNLSEGRNVYYGRIFTRLEDLEARSSTVIDPPRPKISWPRQLQILLKQAFWFEVEL